MSYSKMIVAGSSILFLAPLVHGMELTLNTGAQLEWTDNVFASSGERRNDLLETIFFGAEVEGSETSYQYGIGYTVSHERYQRDSFADESYYNGEAFFLWVPLAGRFDWRFAIESDVTQRSSLGAATPANRDQRTTYSTAPRLVLLSLPRDNVYVEGNASRITFREDEGNDSDRAGGTVGWEHAISTLTLLSLIGNKEKVTFDENGADYERSSYRLGVTRQINGGSVSLSVGQTELYPENANKLRGTNAASNFTWSNATHTISLDATRDLTDTSAGFGDWANGEAFNPGDVNTGEVALVTRTRVSLADTYRFSQTIDLLGMVYSDSEQSDDETIDAERLGLSLRAIKDLSESLSVRAEFSYERDQNRIVEAVERTSTYELAIEQRLEDRIFMSGWLRREDATNDVDDLDYEIHTVGVSGGLEF